MEERINAIINGKGLYILDIVDFGDLKCIKYHKKIETDKIDDFELDLTKQEKESIKAVIVHVFSKDRLDIDELSDLLNIIKSSFINPLKITFGSSEDDSIKGYIIDIFAKI